MSVEKGELLRAKERIADLERINKQLARALQVAFDCITADAETDQAMGYPSVDIAKALRAAAKEKP